MPNRSPARRTRQTASPASKAPSKKKTTDESDSDDEIQIQKNLNFQNSGANNSSSQLVDLRARDVAKELRLDPFDGTDDKEERTAAFFLSFFEDRLSDHEAAARISDILKRRVFFEVLEPSSVTRVYMRLKTMNVRTADATWDQTKEAFLHAFNDEVKISQAIATAMDLPRNFPTAELVAAFESMATSVQGWSAEELVIQQFLSRLPSNLRANIDVESNRTKLAHMEDWGQAALAAERQLFRSDVKPQFRRNSWSKDKPERVSSTTSTGRDHKHRSRDQSRDFRSPGSAPPTSSALVVSSHPQQKN
jgi:hypothetical protein